MEREKIIEQQISKLPFELRKYLADEAWLQTTRSIALTQNLTEEQTQKLEDEVLFVLIGLEAQSNFGMNLNENLGVTIELTEKLSGRIEEEIFSVVTKFLPNETADLQDTSQEGQPEEKILETVGSPGEKLAWEQRKQIAANALPKTEENKYGGIDPYREPLG